MKLDYVRTITLSCMVGFENSLVQMIIMAKQRVVNKVHVATHSLHLSFVHRSQ